jgi:conjugative relaxase-like TrwC/TraI family protein
MVVSIKNISPTHGSSYYAQEGHYSESKTRSFTITEFSQRPSNWYGKLAPTLEVSGQVETQIFNHLLKGRSPNDETLVSKHLAKGAKARAGIDLTTSAPKSVSLQALMFNDQRLEMAHREATNQMLDFLEERYAFTRQMVGGNRTKLQTGKALIAQFHHDTSRELDPQLHTHNIILNLQQTEDGKWRSLDNEAIYRAKMLLGLVYRNELARKVQQLGYEIEVVNYRQGLWELKGFSSKQLDQFSKRSQQIQQQAGIDASSQHKAWVAIASGRKKKQSISREELAVRWQEEAIAFDLAPIEPKRETPFSVNSSMAKVLVQVAVEQLASQSATFCQGAIEKVVLSHVGQVSLGELQAAIAYHPNLIISTDLKGHRFCTYQETATHDRTEIISEFSRSGISDPGSDAVAGICPNNRESSSTFYGFGTVSQFRQSLPPCPGVPSGRGGLAELAPTSTSTSDSRTIGEAATMAQTASNSPDSTATTSGESADGDQSLELSLQQVNPTLSGGVDSTNSTLQIYDEQDELQLERDRR